jgi:pyruvate kinase
VQVIAKIECLTGIKAHREIIDAADVIVLSRGNLGTRCAQRPPVSCVLSMFPVPNTVH